MIIYYIMINEPNKTLEETNLQKIGNLIKIPYYDLIEETKSHSTFLLNGFSITELDETNEEYYQDDDIPDIETEKGLQLKKKAEFIENYYMNYSDAELSNVHCSKCFLNCFNKNELLYFKDRKSLISYLKYCFIFLKKSLFVNHLIYMNNRYDLFKIDNSYLIGFHFFIPKTICKSCFIQLINKDFLLSKLKNEISDKDESNYSNPTSPKKKLNLLRKKKKRKENNIKNEKKKEKNEDIMYKIEEESALKSIQISPIVIPLSNNVSPIKKLKKRRIRRFGIKKRKKINIKKNTKKIILNDNVIYDSENNIIIINKKILNNLNLSEDKNESNNSPIKPNNESKPQIKEIIVDKQIETNKIGDNYKSVKSININKNKENNDNTNNINNINKENIKKEKKEKYIVNKTNTTNKINTNGIKGIDMNKIGLIQINSNSNNIYNNNQNNIIPINQFIYPNYYMSPQKIVNDLSDIYNTFNNIFLILAKIHENITDNSIMKYENNKILAIFILKLIEEISNKIEENRILMEYSFLIIKKYIENIHLFKQTNEVNLREFYLFEQKAMEIQDKYKILYWNCFIMWKILISIIEEGNNINITNKNKDK